VVALDKPPAGVRPGLSATVKITTATRDKALAIPIQALTIRRQADLNAAEKTAKKGKKKASKGDAAQAQTADSKAADTTGTSAADRAAAKKEVQGVFVLQNGHAQFRPVKTGIMSVTDIEILDGLKEGEEIVTGSYKVLRELKPQARIRKSKAEEAKPAK